MSPNLPEESIRLGEVHFDACTKLLNKHVCTDGLVNGDIINVLASNSNYGCSDFNLMKCTRHGVIEGYVMEDVSHWNVIVGENNVNRVGDIMKMKMEQHSLAESMVKSMVPAMSVFR